MTLPCRMALCTAILCAATVTRALSQLPHGSQDSLRPPAPGWLQPAASTAAARQPAAIDSMLFAAVLRTIRAAHDGRRPRVDPTPAHADPDSVAVEGARPHLPGDTALRRGRALLVLAAGLDTVDVTALGRCAGIMVPEADAHASCPREPEFVVAVAMPRQIGDAPTAPATAAPRGARAVIRVVEIGRAPGGSSVEVFDDTYERVAGASGGWTRTGRRAVLVRE